MADAGLLGLGVFGVRGVWGVSGIVGILARELPVEVLLGVNTPFPSMLTLSKGSTVPGRLIGLGGPLGAEFFRCGEGDRRKPRLDTLLAPGILV